MSKLKFLTNKYTVSVLILLVCMGVDVILHKGMSRVMLPSSFTNKIQPYNIHPDKQPLRITDKNWTKAVNSVAMMNQLDSTTAGLECDLYFDISKNTFFVYHDSVSVSQEQLKDLLSVYRNRNMQSSLWFDLKNINLQNSDQLIKYVNQLNDSFQIKGKTIIETSVAECLPLIHKENYFTSYYVPFFNPYEMEEKDFLKMFDSIANNLKKYPACALSGYYFQYPALKKFFPNYPILTWSDRSPASVVSYTFNRSLQHDSMVKVVLYNR